MKKLTSLPLLLLITLSVHSQDIGFRTTDVGGEFQWYPDGKIYNLHLAFNAKLNHSFQVRAGYNHINTKVYTDHTEKGSGWGGGLGYRYYFKPFPYQFFIGLRADIWNMTINWSTPLTEIVGIKRLIFYPAAETGYTFIINDQCFITICGSLGTQTVFKKEGQKVNYGGGFTSQAGISAGFRL